MIESNCLILPADLFKAIGGLDERFDEPGAGFANLDLFHRARVASPEPVIALVGEATFHQFHDGTTTNVSSETKDARVRYYHNRYIALHGKPYVGTDPMDLRTRGQIRNFSALYTRQRPASTARLGITNRIRPGSIPLHFDEYAQEYLQSAYVECGLHEETRWMGHNLGIAPADALQIQELLVRLRPDCVVAVNVRPGLLILMESVLRALAPPAPRIVAVGDVPYDPAFAALIRVPGAASDPETPARARHAAGTAECILVLFAPDEADLQPAHALRAFAGLVSLRSYIIFLGTSLGQPWLGYSRRWYRAAVQSLVEHANFVVDTQCTRQLVTTSPMGYLQRIE
jgi:cephalosporin hydroxylase